jgi:hypothetical protein
MADFPPPQAWRDAMASSTAHLSMNTSSCCGTQCIGSGPHSSERRDVIDSFPVMTLTNPLPQPGDPLSAFCWKPRVTL